MVPDGTAPANGAVPGLHQPAAHHAQRERLLALGSLSAGLTHELNNPAAAAVRATATLQQRVSKMREKLAALASGHLDEAALQTLIKFQDEAAQRVAAAPKLSAIEAADREDELSAWLDDHDVANAFQIAPTFVQAGIDSDWLDLVANGAPSGSLAGAIHWLYYTVDTELLMKEITDSATRISTLVGAAKQYSQMDRSPHQNADLHELLDSTLVMMAGKIPSGVTVVKDYADTLPPVPSYAAELNQVWTNLIDNALEAMDGQGTLTIRTHNDDDHATVQISDTGLGIPDEDQGTDLRAVLHDQAHRPRHRPRSRHRLAHRRQQASRLPEGDLCARGHDIHSPTSARGSRDRGHAISVQTHRAGCDSQNGQVRPK